MTIDYAALQSTAKTLITNNGQSVTFKKKARGSYNPQAGFASESSSTFTAQVVLLGSPKTEVAGELVKGRLLDASAYSDTEIEIGDTCTINSENWRVQEVDKIQPSTTIVYYEIKLQN